MAQISFTLTDPNTILLFVGNLLEKSGKQKSAEISKEEVRKTSYLAGMEICHFGEWLPFWRQ